MLKSRNQKTLMPPKSDFQRIWVMARCNGADYREPPRTPIEWPKGGWLERRREYLRQERKKK